MTGATLATDQQVFNTGVDPLGALGRIRKVPPGQTSSTCSIRRKEAQFCHSTPIVS
jgi:hypothetical protein